MRNPKQTLKQTIILAIYFMLTYTTYLSFSCIITYIAENDHQQYDYGPLLALVLNYSVYFVTLIFSSGITNYKRMFQVSAFCHMLNYAVYIPDFKGQMGVIAGVVGAIFGGYGAAIYWVSQGGYMIKLFKRYNVKENEQGKYFGIINGIVFGSSLFGALVTTFGLGLFGTQIYFIILTILGLASWAVCTFFLDSLQTDTQQSSMLTHNASENTDLILFGPKQPKLTYWEQFKLISLNTIKYYPKMYYIWLPVIFDGLITGFISTYLSKVIPESLRNQLNVGYLLMIEGLGCIIGAITSAIFSDRYSVLNIGKVGMLIIVGCCGFTYLNYVQTYEQLYIPFGVAFAWGFIVNYLTSLESVSCAKINKGYLYSFSIVRQIQALAFIGFQIYMIVSDNNINLIGFLIILASLSLAAIIVLFQFQVTTRRVPLILQTQ